MFLLQENTIDALLTDSQTGHYSIIKNWDDKSNKKLFNDGKDHRWCKRNWNNGWNKRSVRFRFRPETQIYLKIRSEIDIQRLFSNSNIPLICTGPQTVGNGFSFKHSLIDQLLIRLLKHNTADKLWRKKTKTKAINNKMSNGCPTSMAAVAAVQLNFCQGCINPPEVHWITNHDGI